jgi:DNA-binding IclR family transcriptional regulator
MKAPQPDPQTSDSQYQLASLSRALNVLFVFSAQQPELSLEELSERVSLNKTSLLRILRTLEAEHFLLRSNGRYRLGPRVLDLGNVFLSTLSVHRVAQPIMDVLARSCEQTVSLAILDDLEIVYIAIEQAQREVGIQGEIGGRHPANATALGKVLLAGLDDAQLKRLLKGAELKRLTHRTITIPEKLLAHLEQVRDRGYALDDEERGIGIRCVAAPIRDHSGNVIAGISLAAPIFHMTEESLPKYTEKLLAAAGEISRQMGYTTDVAVPAEAPA